MIDDPMFYLIAVPALLVVGISKGGFGSGLGIVAVPALTLVVPVWTAVGIMLPLLCLMDISGVWSYRKSWDRRLMMHLAPGAILGIAIASLVADQVDEMVVKGIIGVIAVAFTLYTFGRSMVGRMSPGEGEARPGQPGAIRGGFWAALSGFTSFVGHAGGPPLQIYLLPLRLDKTVFVGTTVIFFMLVNYAKLVPFIGLGILNAEAFWTALVLAPLCPLFMRAGVWLHARVPDRPFYISCYVFVFIVGCKLLWDAAPALI